MQFSRHLMGAILTRAGVLGTLLTLCSGCSMMNESEERALPAVAHVLPAPAVRTEGAIYQAGRDVDYFSDLKARHIGDILTIKLQESTNATKNAVTKTSKATSLTNSGPTLFGKAYTNNGVPLFSASLDGKNSFDGSGSSAQSNSLAGSLTVTVIDVQQNGNLVVQGEKSLKLNQGDEFVRIAGVVRSADIGMDNTVTSDKIADARITYSGKGAISNSNRMGWLARFFNSQIMPY